MITSLDTNKKIALISGAFGYVGFEISKKLAQDGICIAMLYNSTDDEVISQKLSELPGEGHCVYKCDLKNKVVVDNVLDAVENDMGRITIFIHAAGKKPKRKALIVSSIDDLKDQFENNIVPSFNFFTACAKRLKTQKDGILIGITTVGVIIPEATRSLGLYIPAKYAIQGMLVMLKEELALLGIRVYSIAPGFMYGGMNDDIPKAFVEIIKEKTTYKKLTTAVDVAEQISYLCSDKSKKEKKLTFVVSKE